MIRATIEAVDTTTVRLGLLILVPLASFIGSFLGLVKMLPEGRSITVDYQLKAMAGMRTEITRQSETIGRLELRIEQLESDPPAHVA